MGFHIPPHFDSAGDKHAPQILPIHSEQPESRGFRFEMSKVKFATCLRPQGHTLQKLIFLGDIIRTHYYHKQYNCGQRF